MIEDTVAKKLGDELNIDKDTVLNELFKGITDDYNLVFENISITDCTFYTLVKDDLEINIFDKRNLTTFLVAGYLEPDAKETLKKMLLKHKIRTIFSDQANLKTNLYDNYLLYIDSTKNSLHAVQLFKKALEKQLKPIVLSLETEKPRVKGHANLGSMEELEGFIKGIFY